MKSILRFIAQAAVASALLIGLIHLVHATDVKTLESDYTPMQLAGISSSVSSTWSVVGVGISYKIFVSSLSPANNPLYFAPSNPAVSYHINFTTDTLKDFKTNVTSFTVASTSETFVPANQLWWDDLRMLGQNPQFVFSNLLSNTTLYFQIQYGQQRTK